MSRPTGKEAQKILMVLAEIFPRCFVMLEWRRRPLKIGIHQDIEARMGEAITKQELNAAMNLYCGNPCYLQHCVEGATRIDLDGNACGTITADEAKHPAARLAAYRAKAKLAAHRPAPVPAPLPAPSTSARKLSLADLKAAAQARRKTA